MTRKSTAKTSAVVKDENRYSQLTEFLQRISDSAKTSNIDHFFRSGEINNHQNIMELGEHFLKVAMGFEHNEFIPCITSPDFPNYVPQSEDYYPWALFLTESKNADLDEVYHTRAINYLHSDSAGKKNYAIITNFKEIGVYDLKHEVDNYSFSLLDLHDAINNNSKEKQAIKALQAWRTFLSDFGPESSKDKKKQRREDVVKYIEPKDDRLGFVKRFGHMPDFQKPIGWDGKEFRETFKTKNLPFLQNELIEGKSGKKELNRLIWGDNLAVLRSLESETIDLVYIDPPFFSGRDYNCIFGDNDEVKTFSDIWDGGLPTYLAWMNARLFEIRRVLKKTGSLVIHLDWHAAHYVKVELDKIFGYDNFRNEIVWQRDAVGKGAKKSSGQFSRELDTIFWYSKSGDWKFKQPYRSNDQLTHTQLKEFRYKESNGRLYKIVTLGDYSEKSIKEMDKAGLIHTTSTGKKYKKYYLDEFKMAIGSLWADIPNLSHGKNPERVGYETQKPEKLLARVIDALTDEGDTVADFFSGGGTTITTAEKLGRKWIGCDISRIAISIARDRLSSVFEKEVGVKPIFKQRTYGIQIESQGAYDKSIVRKLDDNIYIKFILECYEAVHQPKGEYIHGFKLDKAIHVGSAKGKVTVDQIEEFHVELSQRKIESGVILAWSWDKEAEAYIDELRSGHHGPEIQLIQVKLVDIDSHEFKGDNIRFLNKPAAVVRYKHQKGLNFVFDGTASQGRNETDIHYYQWDFNYKGRFSPMTKPNFGKDTDGDGNPLNDNRKVEYEFPADGKYKVALRVIDKSGAEDTHIIDFDTNEARSKKAA